MAIVEMARFSLLEGMSEAALLAASAAMQTGFLATQSGFLSRDLVKLGPGRYMDLVRWQGPEFLAKAMAVMMQAPTAVAYFAVMDMKAFNPESDMVKAEVLASYS